MLTAYRLLTFCLYPFFIILIYLRLISKKEDPKKYKEKIFSSSFKVERNDKDKLIWFHASSIGETLSVLPLIDELNRSKKDIRFLITTVTLSSANLLNKKIKKYNNMTHRFFPLDTTYLVEKFLNAWKPNLVCFVDSEIWPNFLFKIKEKKIPLVLINARITRKTFTKWHMLPNFAKQVFNNFDLCLPCSEESMRNLEKLQVKKLSYIGNLKFTIKAQEEELEPSDIKVLNNFKVWCAVSTHEGEEIIALKTHLEIKKKYNNVLTIIIPRHISRVSHVQNLIKKFNLESQILNPGDTIDKNKEILIINSFGVLHKYFNYCQNVFIGKSLLKQLSAIGGQDPIEAAKLNCRVYFGPYVYNFEEVYNFLKYNNMAEQISNEFDLSDKIIKNFNGSKKIDLTNTDLLNNYGKKILQHTIMELNKFIQIK